MMNWKVSFTAQNFTELEIQQWIEWLGTNIRVKEVSYARDAKDNDSPVERLSSKRVGR